MAYLYIAGLFVALLLFSCGCSFAIDWWVERQHRKALQEELDACQRAHDLRVMAFTAEPRRRH